MSFLRKTFFILIVFISHFHLVGAKLGDPTIKDNLLGEGGVVNNTILSGSTLDDLDGSSLSSVDTIFNFVKTSISSLLMLIALGVFLFIGIRLAVARGNPEEFKKALIHFVYAVVGIFIVSVAWAVVKLVAGLNVG